MNFVEGIELLLSPEIQVVLELIASNLVLSDLPVDEQELFVAKLIRVKLQIIGQ